MLQETASGFGSVLIARVSSHGVLRRLSLAILLYAMDSLSKRTHVEKIHSGMVLQIVDTDEWAGYLNQTPESL